MIRFFILLLAAMPTLWLGTLIQKRLTLVPLEFNLAWAQAPDVQAGNLMQMVGVLAGFTITVFVLIAILSEPPASVEALQSKLDFYALRAITLGLFITSFVGYIQSGVMYSASGIEKTLDQFVRFSLASVMYHFSLCMSFAALLPMLTMVMQNMLRPYVSALLGSSVFLGWGLLYFGSLIHAVPALPELSPAPKLFPFNALIATLSQHRLGIPSWSFYLYIAAFAALCALTLYQLPRIIQRHKAHSAMTFFWFSLGLGSFFAVLTLGIYLYSFTPQSTLATGYTTMLMWVGIFELLVVTLMLYAAQRLWR